MYAFRVARQSLPAAALVAGSTLLAACLDVGEGQPADGSGGVVASGGGTAGTGAVSTGGTGGTAGTGAVSTGGAGGAGGAGGVPAFPVLGVVFDGVTDWLDRKAPLGTADSKQVTGSIWFKRVGLGSTYCIGPEAAGSGSPNALEWTASDRFRVVWRRAGGGVAVDLYSAAVTDTASWHHVMFSADLSDQGKRHLYLDGVPSITVNFYSDTLMDNTGNQWGLFADNGGDAKYNGEVAEMWLALGSYLDLSQPALREQFRSAAGQPVNLGPDGSLPTGTAPTIYLSLRAGQPANAFAANRGNGGGFLLQGELQASQTSPSD